MKKSILFLASLLFTVFTYGQEYEVHGVVKDEAGLTLPGVSVYVKETKQGVTTDFDGKYSITLEGDANLVFTFMGMQTERVAVNSSTGTLNLTMKESSNVLSEVTVVGYGAQKKSDKTGSVSSIKETESMKRQYSTVDGLLQGRMSGVQVNAEGGQPGGAISVKIRGTNSLRGNNEPLYVIDGVVISSAGQDTQGAFGDANEMSTPTNGLAGLNPRDIESMEVLKDASATAIYGSRGANGVILITTKQGKKGEAKYNAYVNVDISKISKKVDVLSPLEFGYYENDRNIIQYGTPKYQIENGEVYAYDSSMPGNKGTLVPQVDWQDWTFEQGVSTTTGISVSGGSDKSKYYVSGGFANLQGIVPNSLMQNADFRLNMTNNLSKKLKLDTRLSLYYSKGEFAQGGSKSGGSRGFINQVLSFKPLLLVGDGTDNEDLGSPRAFVEDYEDKFTEFKVNASLNLSYSISKHFKYQFRSGTNIWSKNRDVWYGTKTSQGQQTNGRLGVSGLNKISFVMDNLLIYNQKFGKHNVNGVFGVVVDGVRRQDAIYSVADFPFKDYKGEAPQFGQQVLTPYTKVRADEQLFSVLARGTYTYNDRYVFTGTVRADGSSKFKGDNQFGYFPALSAAWRVSQEDFLSDSDLISSLKLRASWGQTGNQAIKPYQTYYNFSGSNYSNGSDNTIIGVVPSNIVNENLKWETTTQYNVGVDYGLWGGRLHGTIDAYYKETKDLLQLLQIPTSNGFRHYLVNKGSISNKGIDLDIQGVIIDNDDFSWSLGGNISFIRNEVLELGIPDAKVWIDGEEVNASYYLGNDVSTGGFFKMPANIFMTGQQVGMFWGYKTDGIYKSDAEAQNGPTYNGSTQPVAGDVKFVDQDGDGNITQNDLTIIGNPNPDFTYGINTDLKYKNFTFSMLFTGVQGNDLVNGNLLKMETTSQGSANIMSAAYHDAWTPSNPDANYPRLQYANHDDRNAVFTDRIIEDGSFLRLSKVSLNYDVPVKSKSINSLSVYVTGSNLLIFTKYSGFDPGNVSFSQDGSIMGVDWGGFPNVRSVLMGVNVSF